MSNYLVATVTVRGTGPLLQHAFGLDTIPATGERPSRTGAAGNDPEEWRRSARVTLEGQLYLEPAAAYATIREAAKYTKKGRASLQGPVAATLQILESRVLLDRWLPGSNGGQTFDLKTITAPSRDSAQPVYLDVRGVRNPATKGRNVRYRVAAAPGWQCVFNLRWDKTLVTASQMEAILHDSGKLVGLGDGRSIGFGRFEIGSLKIREDG